MNKWMQFLKTTILGGLVFLIPLVIVVTVVGKGIQLMMTVAEPIGKFIPLETFAGIALVNLIAITGVIAACFASGFIAKSILGQKVFESLDGKLLAVPGYALFKARLTGNMGVNVDEGSLKPVLVKLGPKFQIGFSGEKIPEGRITVFLPGAPDPWKGSIVIVDEEQVTPLNSDLMETKHIFESLGRGTEELLRGK